MLLRVLAAGGNRELGTWHGGFKAPLRPSMFPQDIRVSELSCFMDQSFSEILKEVA